jgi:hypothetical protein
VHQLLKDVVASLLQNLDAKQQVLIMAEKLANKALQIEQGILFLNPVHEHNLPKLMLPPSWKIAFDALLLEDEAKLSAGGSEWRTQFSNLKQALLQWFDEQAPEEVIDSIDETEDITLEQTQSTHPEEENEQAQALDETYDYFSDRHEENNEVLEDNDEDNDDDEDEYDEDGDEDNEDDNDLDKSVFNR